MSEAIQVKDLIYISIIIILAVTLIVTTKMYLQEKRGHTLSVIDSIVKNVEGFLSKRELEIYLLQQQGFSAKQIASKLNIAKSTVDTHSTRINSKLREAGLLPL